LGWFVRPKFSLCNGLGWVWLKKLDQWTAVIVIDLFGLLSVLWRMHPEMRRGAPRRAVSQCTHVHDGDNDDNDVL